MKIIYYFTLLCFVSFHASGTNLIIENGVLNPNDSLENNKIIDAINGLLSQKEKPNSENEFILESQLLETSVLIDELKGIEYDKATKTADFYKPFLQSLVKLRNDDFSINLVYKNIDASDSYIRADFRILAREINGKYYLFSPLRKHTIDWKKSELRNNTFFYKRELDIVKAQDYLSYIYKYDELIGNVPMKSTFYFADDFAEVLSLIGVKSKPEYNKVKFNSLHSIENGELLKVNGTVMSGVPAFDPHDLWHSRLRLAINPKDIYKPVDEGCAFLFGGSWGYSWETIKSRFKKYVKANPDADWLKLQSQKVNYGTEKGKDLRVDYTINALIVKKIMQEKGFESVRKLVSIGREQKNLDKYFEVLESITGINRENFNAQIADLIKEI